MSQTKNEKFWIDCRNVSLGYEGQAIWEGLSFQVRPGDYLCIVGENGLLRRVLRRPCNETARRDNCPDILSTP